MGVAEDGSAMEGLMARLRASERAAIVKSCKGAPQELVARLVGLFGRLEACEEVVREGAGGDATAKTRLEGLFLRLFKCEELVASGSVAARCEDVAGFDVDPTPHSDGVRDEGAPEAPPQAPPPALSAADDEVADDEVGKEPADIESAKNASDATGGGDEEWVLVDKEATKKEIDEAEKNDTKPDPRSEQKTDRTEEQKGPVKAQAPPAATAPEAAAPSQSSCCIAS